MLYAFLIILIFLIPYNTIASITLNNHDGYLDKRAWYLKIWFLPVYGAYVFFKYHKNNYDDNVGEEAAKELAPETTSEAIDRILDDVDF